MMEGLTKACNFEISGKSLVISLGHYVRGHAAKGIGLQAYLYLGTGI
jgi:hypothetical protein